MHDGCGGSFESGKQVVDKLRAMGFSSGQMPIPLQIECTACGKNLLMDTFEYRCGCGMVFGVTPCHAFAPEHVQEAGIDY